MQALEIIDDAQSGNAVANLAATLNIPQDQAQKAVEAALPELTRAIERNTLSRSGLIGLVGALGQGHHEQILDTPAIWTDPRVLSDGEAILDHILGSEKDTEKLAARAMQASGLGSSIIKLLLPILAQWLMGALAKSTKGGLGDILSRLPIPGGGQPPAPRQRPSSRDGGGFDTGGTMGDNTGFDLPKSDLPGGGFPMPPIPGSNSGGRQPWPRADAPPARQPGRRSGSGFDLPSSTAPEGGYPMPPIPREPDGGDFGRDTYDGRDTDNPYGDLTDILRRGGRLPSGEKAENGGLWTIVRNAIGSALGFGNKGILGWIVQLVLLRWGWSFLRRILLGR